MKGYQKMPGPIAKFFLSNKPGYAYFFFKTHELQPDMLKNVLVFDILVHLLQLAEDITTSNITALLEHIFQPISVKFCNTEVDEYCRDSIQYLQELDAWKAKYSDKIIEDDLYIVAGDVKALYPTLFRQLVKNALNFALTRFLQYFALTITILVDIAIFCLDNVIIQYKEKFFTQSNGIITGDNHSISLPNIALHYVILPIASAINHRCYLNVLLTI